MESYWQEHKGRLLHYINRKVDDPTAAEDILHDVYLKAHSQLHKLKSEESIGGWLYRIAHNTIMDHFRQQKHWEELSETIEPPEEDKEEKAHQELSRCLAPLLKELPEKYSTPLQMSELEGMSQQKVADELGLSLSGSKSRIQRGRALLREHFTNCCDVEVGRGGVTDFTPKNPDHNC
ncbi:RNA polymerase sigma factor SigZ [Endozoicomonas sp. OPT23]|uniref:RNA polymerase sigma factor SigZ n=1 Tax=Endozoicomonas sp. OPT23 TaxID=2072845 RepID=UPI00129AC826|nr:RNA polymerase sigma factor SigZ [Endozoicomonas sp. OPT23]MRI31418.1 RNA polymerase sigma factor SigZ [Endozoicomonas sp. OPT23]